MANLKLLPETSEEIEESIQLLKGGSLKAAFLGKYQDAELKFQVVVNPVMVGGKEVRKECLVSDSRDCSSHWLISDTGLVKLITKGCQPIISASSWAIEVQGNQPILVVERYTVVTEQRDRVGWPEPIESQFFNLNLIGGFSKLHI